MFFQKPHFRCVYVFISILQIFCNIRRLMNVFQKLLVSSHFYLVGIIIKSYIKSISLKCKTLISFQCNLNIYQDQLRFFSLLTHYVFVILNIIIEITLKTMSYQNAKYYNNFDNYKHYLINKSLNHILW